MPSRLLVIAGPETGREFPLEDEVLRLGSDAVCGIRLTGPEIPPHAATLEFREGAFVLHNRCDQDIVLSGQALPSRGFARWTDGENLILPGGLTLQLVVEGDPRPQRREFVPAAPMSYPEIPPESTSIPEGGEEEEETGAAVGDPKASKKWGQLVVIVGCALLGVYLLLFDSSADPAAGPRNPRKDFEEVVQGLLKRDQDPTAQSLLRMLQNARIAELRQENQEAQDQYGAVRDRLLSLGNPDDPSSPEEYRMVWAFIKLQMKPVVATEF